MKIGLLGGAFDPPHHGHLLLARTSLEQLGLDRLIFIPTRHPPHKEIASRLDGFTRSLMIRIAARTISPSQLRRAIKQGGYFSTDHSVERLFLSLYSGVYLNGNETRYEVSDIELERNNELPSYTLDTVKEIRNEYSNSEIILIIGADQADIFDSWYCWRELADIVQVQVAARSGSRLDEILNKFPFMQQLNFSVIEISSTLVRERLRKGLSIAEYVPFPLDVFLTQKSIRSKL